MENTFGIPIIPENEDERLKALQGFNISKSYDEQGTFKHIASMASRMFNVPIAIINLVDADNVLSLAQEGLGGRTSIPRGTSLCSLAILNDTITVFENAKEDACLLANPMVTGEFGLKFYAAAPLKTAQGFNIGALCIVDKVPREFSDIDKRILENLASIVMEEIEKESKAI